MRPQIVFDNVSNKLVVPARMGHPRSDQLNSTDLDNLCELAGRACYDSLGQGRNSQDYHKHIIEVNHGSVWEHANLVFQVVGLTEIQYLRLSECLSDRPGVYKVVHLNSGSACRFVANLRAIREWDNWGMPSVLALQLGGLLKKLANEKAPLITQGWSHVDEVFNVELINPYHEEEIWVSIFFDNVSRGFSHELVRHKYQTAISQRSTRYVDESDSNWPQHPLLVRYFSEAEDGLEFEDECGALVSHADHTYNEIVKRVEPWLIAKGVDKFTARKQVRGAARGYLGNALETQMIFSASIAQWKRILRQRASKHADAEIRVVFNEIYILMQSRFPQFFERFKAVNDCPEGIGFSVYEQEIRLNNENKPE